MEPNPADMNRGEGSGARVSSQLGWKRESLGTRGACSWVDARQGCSGDLFLADQLRQRWGVRIEGVEDGGREVGQISRLACSEEGCPNERGMQSNAGPLTRGRAHERQRTRGAVREGAGYLQSGSLTTQSLCLVCRGSL